ncbi:MAG: arginine--tRNA ligase [Clostridiales bacterium]|nr:arginine--tRNA ligase [Clostridiales bacterium]
MLDIKQVVAKSINEQLPQLDFEQIYENLEYPPSVDMGDVALPCFKLSRLLRKSPAQIAQELAAGISTSEFIEKVEAVSGYLNFFINRPVFMEKVIDRIMAEQEKYGSLDIGKSRNIVIDYSAPNIAKPFHVGHLRSTAIGNSLRKIFEFMGYNCIGINYLGDWGTQFGKLIVAYNLWGSKEAVEDKGIKELMRLYVKFHQEAEKDPGLEDEARSWFARLERGDRQALELWQWFKNISIEEFKKVYDLMDVHFDYYTGESFYNDKIEPIIEELRQKGLLKESEGALIVDLEKYDMPPCLILKKDGSSLYATRDIAAAIHRKKEYNFDKCIYVTGASQSLHFRQWFKVIELMGYEWADDLIHVPFGIVSLSGEKLATRTGKVVLLEDILNEAIKKTLEIIESKNPGLENKEEVARYMGVGAVIFNDLYSNRIKDVSFSWDEILNFDGETGPYVQYTYARACSVIRKTAEAGSSENSFNSRLLQTKEEYLLCKALYEFPEKVEMALEQLEPSIITRYLVDLAQEFNRFYHEHSILVDDMELRKARLSLVKATKITLANGLRLIGLRPLEKV